MVYCVLPLHRRTFVLWYYGAIARAYLRTMVLRGATARAYLCTAWCHCTGVPLCGGEAEEEEEADEEDEGDGAADVGHRAHRGDGHGQVLLPRALHHRAHCALAPPHTFPQCTTSQQCVMRVGWRTEGSLRLGQIVHIVSRTLYLHILAPSNIQHS